MKTYIWRQQHKNFKHQDIKQKEPSQMKDLKKNMYVFVMTTLRLGTARLHSVMGTFS